MTLTSFSGAAGALYQAVDRTSSRWIVIMKLSLTEEVGVLYSVDGLLASYINAKGEHSSGDVTKAP